MTEIVHISGNTLEVKKIFLFKNYNDINIYIFSRVICN